MQNDKPQVKVLKTLRISEPTHRAFKVIAAETGSEINALADKVLARFTRDSKKKPTLFSLLDSDLLKES